MSENEINLEDREKMKREFEMRKFKGGGKILGKENPKTDPKSLERYLDTSQTLKTHEKVETETVDRHREKSVIKESEKKKVVRKSEKMLQKEIGLQEKIKIWDQFFVQERAVIK